GDPARHIQRPLPVGRASTALGLPRAPGQPAAGPAGLDGLEMAGEPAATLGSARELPRCLRPRAPAGPSRGLGPLPGARLRSGDRWPERAVRAAALKSLDLDLLLSRDAAAA